MDSAEQQRDQEQDMDIKLGEMVLRCLLRNNSDGGSNSLIVVGTMATNTPLPPGDYSLTLHLSAEVLGQRCARSEHLLAVPDGMIPLGMGPDDLLTSSIDLSPFTIRRFKSANLNPVDELSGDEEVTLER